MTLLRSCEAGVADTVKWLSIILDRYNRCSQGNRRRSPSIPVPACTAAGADIEGEAECGGEGEQQSLEGVAGVFARLFVSGGGGRLCVPAGFALLSQVNGFRQLAAECRPW